MKHILPLPNFRFFTFVTFAMIIIALGTMFLINHAAEVDRIRVGMQNALIIPA